MADADSFASDVDVFESNIAKIHRNVLNPELEREIEAAFSLFDKDGNGKLDFFECQAAFRALRLNASRETVKAMFAELNKDVEDILTISDFKTLVIKVIHRRYNAGEAAKIFELLEDGSGKITRESLAAVLRQLGGTMDDEDLNIMIKEAANGKDYVKFDDFRKILKLAWRGDTSDELYDEK